MNIVNLPYSANPEVLFLRLSHLPHCVWLDSGKPSGDCGRYDILSAQPSQILTATSLSTSPSLSERINARLTDAANLSHLPFSGGWIGQMDYEFRHDDFGLNTCQEPTAWFGWYDWAIVVDHQHQTTSLLTLSSCSAETISKVHAALSGAPSRSLEFACSTFSPDETKKQYLESMARIREYLLAGDCYQVNYTQRFSAQFSGSPVGAYLRLRQTVPSPFSAYLDTGDRTLLSVSPERFIRVHDRAALTQPIKGTARRGLTDSEDLALKEELRRSEKNRAENVMIVDLLRNDFGQVCETGSVKVPNLMDIHSFANVHHLVSTITGTLPVGIRHSDLIFSCFPGGSITGAPKRRAMEIIAELEHQRRSAYCGSIGYFSCNQNTDFNIAIRTMEHKRGQIHVWAGGGIVIDSEGEAEYEECFAKISTFMRSLENR